MPEDNNNNVPSDESMEVLFTFVPEEDEDIEVEKQNAWLDGHHVGYLTGFDTGLAIGREQGYEDCVYRIKQMAADNYDPRVEAAIKYLAGD